MSVQIPDMQDSNFPSDNPFGVNNCGGICLKSSEVAKAEWQAEVQVLLQLKAQYRELDTGLLNHLLAMKRGPG